MLQRRVLGCHKSGGKDGCREVSKPSSLTQTTGECGYRSHDHGWVWSGHMTTHAYGHIT